MQKFKVTFYPDNKTVEVARDTTVLAAAISAGIYINSACGGEGVCGRCKVILKNGQVLSQSAGKITQEDKKRGIYLACISEVQSDLEIEIPAESRLNLEGLTQEEVNRRLKQNYSTPEEIEPVRGGLPESGFKHCPLTIKLYLELERPSLEDKISDLERLEREIEKVIKGISSLHSSLANIKPISELLRDSAWKITVTLAKKNEAAEIMQVEPGNTSGNNFGVVFDIGTTTVSAQLIDLVNKKILGTKATYNKQAAFGSDVITRIIYAKDSDGLETLHGAVSEDMNEMAQGLAREHSVNLNDVTAVVCAGNTTMIHLLLRIDPTYIRKEPYVPTLNFVPLLRASEAELRVNPHGLLACVPGVSSYIGGDVTSGVLATGIYKEDTLSILIDIGTNGEVVLGNKDFLISAAASAGPAFEGSGVACGMRASKGAIQKVKISPEDLAVSFGAIGGVKPLGICGSGYIDVIAEMLKAALIGKNGKINDINHKRIRQGDNGGEFILVFKEDSGTGEDIIITDADIENAVNIGLLPDLRRERFVFVGNTSLSGARQIILSNEARKLADEIARKITYFELSVEAAYMDEYIAALFFPHTDLTLFPSLKISK